jgi:hypothetical protein
MKALLSKDDLALRSIANKIDSFDFDFTLHPFPLGRQMACLAIAERKFKHSRLSEAVKNKIFSFGKQIKHQNDFVTGFPAGYHFHVMESLFLIKEWDVLIKVFQELEFSFPEIDNYKNSWLYNMILTYYSTALFCVGKKKLARDIFSAISFELAFKDAPWYKEYFRLQYLKAIVLIEGDIGKARSTELSVLQKKLGFSFFK